MCTTEINNEYDKELDKYNKLSELERLKKINKEKKINLSNSLRSDSSGRNSNNSGSSKLIKLSKLSKSNKSVNFNKPSILKKSINKLDNNSNSSVISFGNIDSYESKNTKNKKEFNTEFYNENESEDKLEESNEESEESGEDSNEDELEEDEEDELKEKEEETSNNTFNTSSSITIKNIEDISEDKTRHAINEIETMLKECDKKEDKIIKEENTIKGMIDNFIEEIKKNRLITKNNNYKLMTEEIKNKLDKNNAKKFNEIYNKIKRNNFVEDIIKNDNEYNAFYEVTLNLNKLRNSITNE